MHARDGITLGLALMLAILMVSPTTAAPIAEGEISAMQAPSDPRQPDHVNNTFHFYGRPNMEPCWGHFNGTDEDSAPNGYGEDDSGGTLDVDLTCRMDPALNRDFMLDKDEMIRIHLYINADGNWQNGNGNCNGDCENLNLTLMRGGREVMAREYDNIQAGQDTEVIWEIPVTDELVPWNKTEDSPALKITMKIKAIEGGWPFGGGTDAYFKLWYANEAHTPQENSTITFPILNDTAAAEASGGDNLLEGGNTPGFGTMIGVGGLALAALLSGRDEDE